MMSDADFVVFTGVAAVALGYALLWLATQFLRADTDAAVMEGALRRGARQLDEAEKGERALEFSAASTPENEVPVLGAPPLREVDEEGFLAWEEREMSRLLYRWGTIATFVGALSGALLGLAGALVGAVAGSIVGTVAVVGVVIYRGSRHARVARAEAAEKSVAPPSTPLAPHRRA